MSVLFPFGIQSWGEWLFRPSGRKMDRFLARSQGQFVSKYCVRKLTNKATWSLVYVYVTVIGSESMSAGVARLCRRRKRGGATQANRYPNTPEGRCAFAVCEPRELWESQCGPAGSRMRRGGGGDRCAVSSIASVLNFAAVQTVMTRLDCNDHGARRGRVYPDLSGTLLARVGTNKLSRRAMLLGRLGAPERRQRGAGGAAVRWS